MTDNTELMAIPRTGAVRVNTAWIFREADGIALIEVDLHSRRAECSGVSWGKGLAPTVILSAGDYTIHLDETVDRDSMTLIEFPGHVGWRVFAASAPTRYTLSVVLVKVEREPLAPLHPAPKD